MSYPGELFALTDRVVIITGGSRGLGREMAFGCARAGADVVIASRKLDACKATATEIKKATGRQAMPYHLHVGRWDQLYALRRCRLRPVRPGGRPDQQRRDVPAL